MLLLFLLLCWLHCWCNCCCCCFCCFCRICRLATSMKMKIHGTRNAALILIMSFRLEMVSVSFPQLNAIAFSWCPWFVIHTFIIYITFAFNANSYNFIRRQLPSLFPKSFVLAMRLWSFIRFPSFWWLAGLSYCLCFVVHGQENERKDFRDKMEKCIRHRRKGKIGMLIWLEW